MSEYSAYVGLDVHKDMIVVAVARELVGFIWAIACEVNGRSHANRAAISAWRAWTRKGRIVHEAFRTRAASEENPRWDYARRIAVSVHPRSQTEAAPRRSEVRWQPTHAYQSDPPSPRRRPRPEPPVPTHRKSADLDIQTSLGKKEKTHTDT